MSRNASQRPTPAAVSAADGLRTYDARRVHELSREYDNDDAVHIRLRVPDSPFTYVQRVDVSFELSAFDRRHNWVEVAFVSAPLPHDSLTATDLAPIQLDSVHITCGSEVVAHKCEERAEGTALLISTVRIRHQTTPVEVSFSSHEFMHLWERPRQTSACWRLAFSIAVPSAKKTVLHLRHSEAFSVLSRIDDADYYTLARGVDTGVVEKVSFFQSPNAAAVYILDTRSIANPAAVARYPLAAAVGLTAGGLAIAFTEAGLTDLASVALALMLLPPVLQSLATSVAFYRSTDLRAKSKPRWPAAIAAVIYVPAVVYALLTIIDLPAQRIYAQIVCYGGGILMLLTAAAYVGAVRLEAIPQQYCDRCGKGFTWRFSMHTDNIHRRTLCRRCK